MAINGIAISDFKFEALQSSLKSMRMEQHFINETNLFNRKTENTFQAMLEGQQGKENANPASNSALPTLPASSLATKQFSQNLKASEKGFIDDFVKSAWPYAKRAGELLGLDPRILLAQAALETGWGQFVTKDAKGLSSNNLFNIKSSLTDRDTVQCQTTEYLANRAVKINASFRKYPSIANSFNDYVNLIQGNLRYEHALANTGNPKRYINELHRAGYATDPLYASKILSIYQGNELQKALERNGF
ncbi:MAG: glucosaminidase domain-containing protein [Tatlockia sp.]|nr:glucosaminidase domain-containing protein [Tatlockia sp.]